MSRKAASGGQSTSLLLLNALQGLLDAKNNLIGAGWLRGPAHGPVPRLRRDDHRCPGVWTNGGTLPNLNGGPRPRSALRPGRGTRRTAPPRPLSLADRPRRYHPPVPPPPAAGSPGPFARRKVALRLLVLPSARAGWPRPPISELLPSWGGTTASDLPAVRPGRPRHAPDPRHRAGQPRERQDRRRHLRAHGLPEQDHPAHPRGEPGREGRHRLPVRLQRDRQEHRPAADQGQAGVLQDRDHQAGSRDRPEHRRERR